MNLEERVSTLEAELDELRTLLVPTRQRAEMVKQSKEQAKAQRQLSARKRARILKMFGRDGAAHCEQEGCRVWFATMDDALRGLQWHHIRSRSLGRDDSDSNGVLLCPLHHQQTETAEAIAERKQDQIGMGKSDKLLPPRMAE